MKRSIAIAALAAIAALGFAQFSGSFTFGGSTTVSPVAFQAMEAFARDYPQAKLSYESVGSSTGIRQLASGAYRLAGSSRELSADEGKAGLTAVPIGLDGLSVVVNKNVPVANLSMKQLAKVFTGAIKNWNEVGGPNAPIFIVNRDETSGTFAAFWELVCQKDFGKTPAFAKNAIVAKENGEVAAKVASTPGAIGYVGMGFVDEILKAGGKELYVDGTAPTVANVVAKKYPISRYLYLVAKGAPKAGSIEKAFIDFVLSAKGQAIVKANGFIPLPKK